MIRAARVDFWAGKTPKLQWPLHHPLTAAAAAFYFSKFRQGSGSSGCNSHGGPDDLGMYLSIQF